MVYGWTAGMCTTRHLGMIHPLEGVMVAGAGWFGWWEGSRSHMASVMACPCPLGPLWMR